MYGVTILGPFQVQGWSGSIFKPPTCSLSTFTVFWIFCPWVTSVLGSKVPEMWTLFEYLIFPSESLDFSSTSVTDNILS